MAATAKGLAKIALVLFLLGGFGLWAMSSAPITRDAPRDLPWTLPDYRLAKTQWEVTEDGKVHTQVQHFFLEGITPQMVSWFYRHLPISTVVLGGTTYPLYHIFHPSEHGTIRVVEPATDGSVGMGPGAIVERQEWFGPFDSRGAARLEEFSDAGMLAIPQVGGFKIGRVRHTLEAGDGGTYYRVDSEIGSDIPVLGSMLNWYLRTQVFHPEMLEQWRRHQVEEVASLQFFLPKIYAQRHSGPPFILD